MGEAKRKRERMTPVEKLAEEMTHRLVDEGLLIRAGFLGYLVAAFPDGCPEAQRHEMEQAFMAGSLHLWRSVMSFLDPGEEPTDKDLRRMDLIEKELGRYEEVLKARAAMTAKTEGNA